MVILQAALALIEIRHGPLIRVGSPRIAGATLSFGDFVLPARVFDLTYRLVWRALVALLLVFVNVLATLLLGLRGFAALLLSRSLTSRIAR